MDIVNNIKHSYNKFQKSIELFLYTSFMRKFYLITEFNKPIYYHKNSLTNKQYLTNSNTISIPRRSFGPLPRPEPNTCLQRRYIQYHIYI
jgi:hypothetical protein